MPSLKDLSGMKFGRLTVVKEYGRDKGGSVLWLCKCECGNEKVASSRNLRRGSTTSCGCYRKENQSKRLKEQWQDEEFRAMKNELSSKILKEQWKDEYYKQMKSEKMSEMVKELWKDEDMKWKMGYKGGITPISNYLRSLPVVSQWRKNTYIRENNRCQLTGKKVHGGNSDVHHLKAFSTIVSEAHRVHNIQVKSQVKDYTEEELHKLEEYVASWHKDTSNAVLLCSEVHDLFHKAKDEGGYGQCNNTPEQFEEFRERYMAGEFKDILEEMFNDK